MIWSGLRTRRQLLLTVCAVTALFSLAPAQADEVMFVTGTRLEAGPGQGLNARRLIGPEDLAKAGGRALDNLLRADPGFQLFRRADSRSANPTAQGLTLRSVGGNGAGRALLTRDGIPEGDPFGGWIAWGAFDASGLASIEITRGAAPGGFGSGALAGAIALDSGRPGSGPGMTLHAGGGNYRSGDASVRLAAQSGPWGLTFSAGHVESRGYVPIPARQAGPIDLPSFVRTRRAELSLGRALDGNTHAFLRMGWFDDARNGGLVLTPNRTEGRDISLRLARDAGRDGWSYDVVAYLKNRDFSAGFAGVDAARRAATPSLDQFAVPAKGQGGKIEVRPPALGPITLAVGLDWRGAEGETRERFRYIAPAYTRVRYAGGRQLIWGFYGDAEWALGGPLAVAGGIRFDHARQSSGRRLEQDLANGAITLSERYAPRNNWLFSGRAGVTHTEGPWALRAMVSRAVRVPSLNELYRPFRVGNDVTEANPALRPERLTGIEVGANFTAPGGTQLGLSLFHQSIADAIANVTVGRGPGIFPVVGALPAGAVLRQRQNLGRVAVTGLELTSRWALTDNLSAEGGLTLSRSRVASAPVVDLVGKRLAQSPAFAATGSLSWTPLSWATVTADLRHLASQFDDDQNERRLKSATTVNLSTVLTASDGITVDLRADNLFDVEVENGVTANGLITRAAPRTLSAGITARF